MQGTCCMVHGPGLVTKAVEERLKGCMVQGTGYRVHGPGLVTEVVEEQHKGRFGQ